MEEKKKLPRKAIIQLSVSLVILGGALLTRWFYPEETRSFIRRYISGGLDYTAVLSDVGGSLRAFVLGVPRPDEAVDSIDNGQLTMDNQDVGDDDSGFPQIIVTLDPDAPLSDGSSVGDDDFGVPDMDPGEVQETNESLTTGERGVVLSGMGGFDAPITWANADYFPSFYDGEDDTLPIPFGTVKPDKVDFTFYELPFTTVQPADGTFTSGFGYRIHPIYGDWRFHYGIDIANDTGSDIQAFADGTVAATGVSGSYGNYIILEHADGYVTLYAHCNSVMGKEKQAVKAGDVIATMGSTGVSTGPHLHFELRRGESFLNPSLYVEIE